jgi:predicted dehydrogenase
VDDYFRIEMFYPATKVILTAGMMVMEPGPRFIIHGTQGSYMKFGIDPQEEALGAGKMPEGKDWGVEDEKNWGFLTTESDDEQVDGRIVTEPGNYMKFYDNVYEVLINNAEQAVKPEEARDVIRIIELAFESSKYEKKVYL